MSPIRSRPFRTTSAGLQTTKVLDTQLRVFASTLDVGNLIEGPRPKVALRPRIIQNIDWDTPTIEGDGSMIGFANRVSGTYSLNKTDGTSSFLDFGLNKLCRVVYGIDYSTQFYNDNGYVEYSRGSYQRIGEVQWTPPYVYADTGMTTRNTLSGTGQLDTSINLYTQNEYYLSIGVTDYDIGFSGGSEMIFRLRYSKNNDGISTGDDQITVRYVYFEDVPEGEP